MPVIKLPSAEISYLDQLASSHIAEILQNLPIVLVHGFSSSIKDNWHETNWISALNEIGLRVIALDIRGHGDSQKFYNESDYQLPTMARDVVELLDYLNIEKSHFMGYSMGSRIASMLTIDHPERVGRLILGGNGYGMIEGSGDWTPIRDGLLAQSPDDIKDPRALAFRRFADRTRSDKRALAACAMGALHKFTEDQFGEIKVRTLVAIGSLDDIAGSGQRLSDCMQNSRFFSIPNRNHMRASTDKIFKQEVAKFLQQI